MRNRDNFMQALFEMFGIGKDCSIPVPNEGNVPEKAQDEQGKQMKTCPFCGYKAEICKVNDADQYMVGCFDDPVCIGYINRVTRVFVTEESAARAWNRRAEE